jgi:hypothetical protein
MLIYNTPGFPCLLSPIRASIPSHNQLFSLTNQIKGIIHVLEAAGECTILAAHLSIGFRPSLSLSPDHSRTVLAVKGSLPPRQQQRALDHCGPF